MNRGSEAWRHALCLPECNFAKEGPLCARCGLIIECGRRRDNVNLYANTSAAIRLHWLSCCCQALRAQSLFMALQHWWHPGVGLEGKLSPGFSRLPTATESPPLVATFYPPFGPTQRQYECPVSSASASCTSSDCGQEKLMAPAVIR